MSDQPEQKPDCLRAEYFDKDGNLVEGKFHLFIADKQTGDTFTGVLNPEREPGTRTFIPHSVYDAAVKAFKQLPGHYQKTYAKQAESKKKGETFSPPSNVDKKAYEKALADAKLNNSSSLAIIYDHKCLDNQGRNTRIFNVNGPVLEDQMTPSVISFRLGTMNLYEAQRLEKELRASRRRAAATAQETTANTHCPPSRPEQPSTTASNKAIYL